MNSPKTPLYFLKKALSKDANGMGKEVIKMFKKRFKCAGEACVEKIEDIAVKIAGVALMVGLGVFIYSSFPYL